jgi:glycine cleavage system H protein
MSEVPTELKYTKSHEWVRQEDDGTVTIGITDHAQELLGDLVFVELPEVGSEMSAEDAVCVVESVKAASDVYMPVSGEVVAVNDALADAPEIINDSPFDDGWLIRVNPSAVIELEDLMDADTYQAEIED